MDFILKVHWSGEGRDENLISLPRGGQGRTLLRSVKR